MNNSFLSDLFGENFDLLELGSILATTYGFAIAGFLAGIIVHEFGHASVGWLAGFHPRLIRIGMGPIVFRARLGSAWFVMRRWPISGSVTPLAPASGRTKAWVAFLLGGIIGNAILLAALWAICKLQDNADDWALPFGAAQIFLIVTSLIPYKKRYGGSEHATDILRVYRQLRDPGQYTIERMHSILMRRLLPRAMPLPAPSPDMPEVHYQITRRDKLTDIWARRNASRILQGLLAADRLPKYERVLVLEHLARMEVTFPGDYASCEQLNNWSAEAVALLETPAVLVTRGGALVALDRPEEAETLLKSVLEPATALGHGALCRAYLAQASVKLGNAKAAQQWLREVEDMKQLASQSTEMAGSP